MSDYECHITVDTLFQEEAGAIAHSLDWNTSKIDGDPLLGDKTHFYLTCHSKNYDSIRSKMLETSGELRYRNIPVIREKIEEILFDRRYDERT